MQECMRMGPPSFSAMRSSDSAAAQSPDSSCPHALLNPICMQMARKQFAQESDVHTLACLLPEWTEDRGIEVEGRQRHGGHRD